MQTPEPQLPKGRGGGPWRLLAIVLGACGGTLLLLVVVLAIVLVPVLSQARQRSQSTGCLLNSKILAASLQMYATDYDEVLPPAGRWEDVTQPYRKDNRVLQCPTLRTPRSYAFNSALDQVNTAWVELPSRQPMLFESGANRRNAADPVASFVLPHTVEGKRAGMVAMLDGSATPRGSAPGADEGNILPPGQR